MEMRDTVTPHQLIKRIKGVVEIAHWNLANEAALENGPSKCDNFTCILGDLLSWFNWFKDLGVDDKN
jgi:hypothetical protein